MKKLIIKFVPEMREDYKAFLCTVILKMRGVLSPEMTVGR